MKMVTCFTQPCTDSKTPTWASLGEHAFALDSWLEVDSWFWLMESLSVLKERNYYCTNEGCIDPSISFFGDDLYVMKELGKAIYAKTWSILPGWWEFCPWCKKMKESKLCKELINVVVDAKNHKVNHSFSIKLKNAYHTLRNNKNSKKIT
jgi:hypothetical protein